MMAAKNNVAAPIPDPATRRLQGDSSRNAIAAATQLSPHAKASSTTSSLALAAASPFIFDPDISWKSGGSVGENRRGRSRYSAHPHKARQPCDADLSTGAFG